MSSEIGNKALLRRVADFLQIRDVKQMPSGLAINQVTPVVDVARLADYELSLIEDSVSLTAAAQYSWNLVDADSDFEQKVLACEITVTGDADAADTGMTWRGSLVYDESTIDLWAYRYWDLTRTTEWTSKWAAWGSMAYALLAADATRNRPIATTWDGFVPRGTSLLGRLDYRGTGWPADTQLDYACLVAKFPRGVRPF